MKIKNNSVGQDQTNQQPSPDNRTKPSSGATLRISKRPLRIIGKDGKSSWGFDKMWLDAEGKQFRKKIKLSDSYDTAVKLLKRMESSSTSVTAGDINAELSKLPDATSIQRTLKNALSLVLQTGFRHDELQSIRLADISRMDEENAYITVNQTKNSRQHMMTISLAAKRIVVDQLSNLSHEFGAQVSQSMPLFPDEHGKPFVGTTLHRRLQRLQQKYLPNLKKLQYSSVREMGMQTVLNNEELRLKLSPKSADVTIEHYMDPSTSLNLPKRFADELGYFQDNSGPEIRNND